MSEKLSRRNFVKGVGLLFGAAGLTGCGISLANDVDTPSRLDSNGFTVRKRGHRYPWWVKTVDQITTEVNPQIAEPLPLLHGFSNFAALEPQRYVDEVYKEAKENVIDGIVNNIPGRSLPDLALHYATQGYLTSTMGTIDGERVPMNETDEVIQSFHMFPPQHFDLPPWQGSPEEASKIVNAAGIQLGATQIGFAKVNPDWLNQATVFDPNLKTHDIDIYTNKIKLPTSYKYVIVYINQAPRDLTIRNQSQLGNAGDRMAYSSMWRSGNHLIRFIKGLGYNAVNMQLFGAVVPFAIKAGLGELGRMNRLINPVFGGNVRLGAILTDLPLAIDKPIDFGLQEFCKNCKVCATKCPSGALSLADEPYWTPKNAFQAAGKKTYFEDNMKCIEYMNRTGYYCSTCLSVCPWSKMDKTALHDISKVLSSQVPAAGDILKKMDESFGYGLIEPGSQEVADWWDLDIPQGGIDSFQGTGEM